MNGSSRTAVVVPYLWSVDLTRVLEHGRPTSSSRDRNSTLLFAISHIISNLTVTNSELQKKALADKEIAPEEYAQLQKLQQIKTQDEHGNPIVETVDSPLDDDTDAMCRERVRRLVAAGVVVFLVQIITAAANKVSLKTVTLCVQSLCQIAAEESSRGILVQRGAFAACCRLATGSGDKQKQPRRHFSI